jgi:mannose-6-phosphate isomerase-like protein (cupin superfamily)
MEPLAVEAGSVLYNPPRTWHRVSNTRNKPLVYLYVCALPPDEANRVESSNV